MIIMAINKCRYVLSFLFLIFIYLFHFNKFKVDSRNKCVLFEKMPNNIEVLLYYKINKGTYNHSVHKKGGKVVKKKRRQQRDGELDQQKEVGNNPKAFKFRSAEKARKLIRR